MGIEVRPVRPQEYEEAGRVTALAYREFANGEDWDRYLERIADVGRRARVALVLVAVDGERVLGSATLELGDRIEDDDPPLEDDEAHIRMLGVHPNARGGGVARALIEACFTQAAAVGRTRMTLHTTQRMQAAQAMYEAWGSNACPTTCSPTGSCC